MTKQDGMHHMPVFVVQLSWNFTSHLMHCPESKRLSYTLAGHTCGDEFPIVHYHLLLLSFAFYSYLFDHSQSTFVSDSQQISLRIRVMEILCISIGISPFHYFHIL